MRRTTYFDDQLQELRRAWLIAVQRKSPEEAHAVLVAYYSRAQELQDENEASSEDNRSDPEVVRPRSP